MFCEFTGKDDCTLEKCKMGKCVLKNNPPVPTRPEPSANKRYCRYSKRRDCATCPKGGNYCALMGGSL